MDHVTTRIGILGTKKTPRASQGWSNRHDALFTEKEMELAIREQRLARGMTASELARRLNTSVANVSRWEREPQRVNLVTLQRIADALSTTAEQLIVKGSSLEATGNQLCRAPVVVTVGSLQSGVPDFPFDHSYLLTITQQSHNELRAGIVEDDAMSPSLRPGDALLIEACSQAARPGVYASMTDDGLQVRRVMPGLEPGTISIVTDNESYPDFNDKPIEAFPVTGKVIWVGRKV